MFGSALASQAVLSAGNFVVGLLLIRHSSDLSYGYYVLISGVIILAVSLQGAFIGPAMVSRMTGLDRQECGALTGGLYREQSLLIAYGMAAALLFCTGLWGLQWLSTPVFLLCLAAICAIASAMQREYFRTVLLAYRRSHAVLGGDLLYAVAMLTGVLLATLGPATATVAVLALAISALLSGSWLLHALRCSEPWDPAGNPGILRDIAPLASWSTAGAGIHWSFSQGYTFVAAATLDIGALAAIAATRLLVMPVNLLSSGIGSLMLPLSSRWLHAHGAQRVLRRLAALALAIAAASGGYFLALWWLRDWLFEVILKKQFADRDLLLLLWGGSFVLMAVNQQMHYLLVVRQRFRQLTALTLLSALLALAISYWGLHRFGGIGAPLGILVGELVNTIGVILLCLRETALEPGEHAAPA